MKALTPAQVEAYRYDGFLAPFPVLTPAETAVCLAGLQRFETFIGSPVPKADMHWRSLTHACLPFYADLVRNPKILDVVEDLIGPDILVWTAPSSSRRRTRRPSPPGTRIRPTSGSTRTSR